MVELINLNIIRNVFFTRMSSFVKKRRKVTSFNWCMGLFVLLVPSIICYSDRSRPLTFEEIYNETNYVQLKHTPRLYNISIAKTIISNQTNRIKYSPKYSPRDETKDNELEYEEYGGTTDNKHQLLVGVSHDPFKYSIPEKDYSKGVREIDPNDTSNKGDVRGKRGVVHLYNMLYCATGCDPISYKGYGCYCGFLGAGRPTDGIDRCCQMHDRCYENIYCPLYTVYFQPYYWKCYRGEPLCALENYHTQHHVVNGCAARLCECDRLFAMCVRRYRCPRRRALCHSSPLRLLQNVLMFK